MTTFLEEQSVTVKVATVILFISLTFGGVWTAGGWVANTKAQHREMRAEIAHVESRAEAKRREMQSAINLLRSELLEAKADIKACKVGEQERKVQYAKISMQLANMEKMLIEIKNGTT